MLIYGTILMLIIQFHLGKVNNIQPFIVLRNIDNKVILKTYQDTNLL